MSTFNKRILVTGGYGFIGSELVHQLVLNYPDYLIVNFDSLTYAGNKENNHDLEEYHNYVPEIKDVRNFQDVLSVFECYDITHVIHMCAESHVDRSIVNPNIFAETNIMGTINLLNAAREHWSKHPDIEHKFVNMGTDEIFGQLGYDDPRFTEHTPFNPRSPYSTSKCAAVMFGSTYFETYGLPVVNMASTNAIGPRQFPEKLVPLTLMRLKNREPIPIYGTGAQIRDWIFVSDFVEALILALHNGKPGELYCIGGDSEKRNIDIVHALIDEYALQTGTNINELLSLINFIEDPRGGAHDFRYGINYSKINNELGWYPRHKFADSIRETVRWYLDNQEWVDNVNSGEYRKWIDSYYDLAVGKPTSLDVG